MTKKLNLSKVSENLTPKERIKLITSLQLKDFDLLTGEYSKKVERGEIEALSPATEQEIAQIISACPPEQAREYNFYVNIKQWVWTRIMPLIESLLLHLDALDGTVDPLRYALTTAPLINHILELTKSQPAIVTRGEYEKAVKKAREQVREEVLELEGRHNLAEQEAFYRLLAEGRIEGYDLLDEWLWFIDRYGKMEKELIRGVVADLKYGAEEYQKEKDRRESEPTLWKEWGKYVGLTDKELEEVVRKEQPEELERPTKEEYELWQKSVKEERERILQAVKKGELKQIKGQVKNYNRETKTWRKQEVEGIQAGSYYDWKGRYQKYAGEEGAEERGYNPLAEDCLEIGLVNGEVGYSGDPDLEGNYKWQPIAIAIPHNELVLRGSPKWVKQEQEHLADLLGSLLLVEIDKKDRKKWLEGDTIQTVRLAPELEEVLKTFVTKATNTINEIHSRIALVEAIEERHFDGMQIVSRDSQNLLGTVGRALLATPKLVNDHNTHLQKVVKLFKQVGFGLHDVEFENLQDFLLNPEPEINQEWVDRELVEIEEWAGGNEQVW